MRMRVQRTSTTLATAHHSIFEGRIITRRMTMPLGQHASSRLFAPVLTDGWLGFLARAGRWSRSGPFLWPRCRRVFVLQMSQGRRRYFRVSRTRFSKDLDTMRPSTQVHGISAPVGAEKKF